MKDWIRIMLVLSIAMIVFAIEMDLRSIERIAGHIRFEKCVCAP